MEDLRKILKNIKKAPRTIKTLTDWFSCIRQLTAYEELPELRRAISAALPTFRSAEDVQYAYDLLGRTYVYEAPVNFDSYCIALEWRRPPEKKFYQPRRRVLKRLAMDLQDLGDGRIDFLGVSLPSRVGKSTLCIFFITWIMGKFPDDANVMSGHSDKLTNGFYEEVLSIICDTETYNWHEIFPDVHLVDKSAKNETVDLHRRKRFPTLTCRSIGGTLTGAVEIGSNGILYCDDLVADLEESLSPDRLQNKYDAYLNTLKDRKKQGAKELMVGTRWSVLDPLGRVQQQYEGNPRYRFTVIPALDENGHSNFEYDYGLGFDTAYYLDMKASIDDATWCAKYMGKPYVREGLLFPKDELRWYNGVLPEQKPDLIVMVADIAWGGGDFTAAPIAYVYGQDVYIQDVLFSNADKTVTKPLMVGKIQEHLPDRVRMEANNGGHEYADDVDDMLRRLGIRINLGVKRAPSNAKGERGSGKMGRIIRYSPDIRKFYFVDETHSSKEYRQFMDQVCMFVQTGKNTHDDAPDALAALCDELFFGVAKVETFQRPF